MSPAQQREALREWANTLPRPEGLEQVVDYDPAHLRQAAEAATDLGMDDEELSEVYGQTAQTVALAIAALGIVAAVGLAAVLW